MLSIFPYISALLLCDKHVNKMLIEATQLLYSAYDVEQRKMLFTNELSPYRRTHIKHPMSIWVRSCDKHFLWLLSHAKSISEQFTERYGKIHACSKHLSQLERVGPPPSLPLQSSPSDWKGSANTILGTVDTPQNCEYAPLCFGEELSKCTHRTDTGEISVVKSYKRYYRLKPQHMKHPMKFKRKQYPVKNGHLSFKTLISENIDKSIDE